MGGVGPDLTFFPGEVNVDDLLKLLNDPEEFFMFSEKLLLVHGIVFLNLFDIVHVDQFASKRDIRVDLGSRLSPIPICIQTAFTPG